VQIVPDVGHQGSPIRIVGEAFSFTGFAGRDFKAFYIDFFKGPACPVSCCRVLFQILFKKTYPTVSYLRIYSRYPLYSGKKLPAVVQLVVRSDNSIFRSSESRSDTRSQIDMLSFIPALRSRKNYDLTERLWSRFDYWYNTAEKYARNILKSDGIIYTDNQKIDTFNAGLTTGFSFNALKHLIATGAG
jgi:hypothetical protein